MNPATNRLAGCVEQHLGRVDLLEHAVADHRHAGAERHRLDLVVGDVHDRGAELLVEPGQLGPHLHPQLGVEVGQGLVHQEGLRLADHGPPDGHPLALAAGQLGRLAGQVVEQGQDLGGPVDAPADHRLGGPAQAHAEADVLLDGHVGVQRVVLEHHRDVAVLGLHVGHHPVADGDLAVGDLVEPGDHAQDRGLAAARRADQHHELAVLDLQRHLADGLHAAGEFLADLLEDDPAHLCLLSGSRPRPVGVRLDARG